MPDQPQPSTTESLGEYLTVNEIATALKLNPQTVRNWLNDGQLPMVRVGQRRVRVRRSALDAFLSGQGDQPPPPAPVRRETVDDRLADLQDQIRGLRARVELLEGAQGS